MSSFLFFSFFFFVNFWWQKKENVVDGQKQLTNDVATSFFLFAFFLHQNPPVNVDDAAEVENGHDEDDVVVGDV